MAAKAPSPRKAPDTWRQYKKAPGLVLAFHGCDRAVGERVLRGTDPHLKTSRNKYDWLGDGIYFWEFDPWRALAFAQEAEKRPQITKGRIKDPYVVGAILDLGLCCNLLEIDALNEIRRAYEYLEVVHDLVQDDPLPRNGGNGFGLRLLDRAVVETMHSLRKRRKLPEYDTVRAAFMEGDPLYPKAGFNAKNHIQIAVRNPDCIKGYFRLPGI